MSPFRFDDSDFSGVPALTADVPAGIRSKGALLDELDRLLRFPDYFGGNWDSLEECIRDLSWLPAGPVVLRHLDLPLAGDKAGQKVYVSILNDTVEKKWTEPGQYQRDFVVIFPPETRDHIDWLLRSAQQDDKR